MNAKVPILDRHTLATRHSDITVERLPTYLDRNRHMVFPHRHNFHHFVLFTQGGGRYSIDFETFDVHPWDMYFMAPGQVHVWEFEGDMDGYVVNFGLEAYQTFLLRPDYISGFTFFSGRSGDSVCTVAEHSRLLVREALDKAIQHFDEGDFVKMSLLFVMGLVQTQIDRNSRTGSLPYASNLMKSFGHLIEKYYQEMRLPKDYAALLHISPNHLNALSKDYFGMSAGEVIRQRILLEAKRMLVLHKQSIGEIAYLLNFNDNSYFSKFFKKAEGMSPEDFRKKHIQQ